MDPRYHVTSAPAPPRVSVLKMLVFALVPAVVMLAVIEAVIRQQGAHTRCSAIYDDSPLWDCDPVLSFKIKGTLKPLDKPLNAAGFRSHEFTIKYPDVYRVLALGDSTTFGMVIDGSGFHYIQTPYPQGLEQLIAERNPSSKVEVLNAGVPGYNSYMGVMLLRERLRSLNPDLITVRYGWNDYLMSFGGDGGLAFREIENPILRSAEDLLLHTATYRYLLRLNREIKAPKKDLKPTAADIPKIWHPNVPLDLYKQNLRRIVEIGRARGAEVWLLTAPHAFLTDENRGQYDKFPATMAAKNLITFSAIPTFDRMIQIHDEYAEATREVGREVGAPVVDMEAVYTQHAAEHLYTSSDVVHPTQLGHDLEAETLYERMVAEGIVK